MVRVLSGFLICFALTAAIFPLGIKLIARLRAEQEILHYVESHSKKSGTPTMGGIIFVITIACVSLALLQNSKSLALVAIMVTAGYGVVGFLDDFIKVRFKRNLGLRAYQKIFFQLAIAVTVSIFAYYSQFVGSTVLLPFSAVVIDLGWGVVPFNILVFLSCTNCVNLTDGLDGLAGNVSMIYLGGFVAILAVLSPALGMGEEQAQEVGNLLILAGTAAGGIMGFLCYNSHPAKVFMGDTGSLALGGCIATLSIFTRTELLIPILGIMFVLSGISVIIQVLHFKRTKTRVFLMAPLHHHFEKKGVHEAKIVALYSVTTLAVAAFSVLIYFLTTR